MKHIKAHLFYISKLFIILSFTLLSCASVKEADSNADYQDTRIDKFKEYFSSLRSKYGFHESVKIEKILINDKSKTIKFFFNKNLGYIPFRPDNVKNIKDDFRDFYGNNYSNYRVFVFADRYEIESLIPNFYRKSKSQYDKQRITDRPKANIPFIKNESKSFEITNGLNGKNILLWPSHGWYFNNVEKRWMWQRARLFQSVEDLGTSAFTEQFLVPMLENAGANVFIPRERDFQKNEIIVDNDLSSSDFYIEFSSDKSKSWKSENIGFAMRDSVLRDGVNPFLLGTSRFIKSNKEENAFVKWIPNITEDGYYAVYISYVASEDNVSDAKYIVRHSGGETVFSVNQKIGGGTWFYLGKFYFKKNDDKSQFVKLSNKSKEKNKIVSADAVRFGGGFGIVERDGQLSDRLKFLEGSRYWLQFAGMPDTLVYNLNNGTDDYKDDYQCRAEYGNYLYGKPFGPSKKRNEKGLGIPIDVSLAFHTDAGITRNDSVIGTLMIYSSESIDSSTDFPNGKSRLANRDLADIVQTQIVEDIRALYDSTWTRRALWDSRYSEATRPNFPSILLELLSHQNFLDMKFHHDPRFRFDASRAIYKGILKFLSIQFGFDYVVQPLPVTHFSAELIGDKVRLKWKPQVDKLEPSALPDKYVVYTRIDDNGFDNGTLIETNEYEIQIQKDKIYSFKVTAVNRGGESFPSEILSVGLNSKNEEKFLIVNVFDRVAPPATIESDSVLGFANFLDEGVPFKYDLNFTGEQYNFDPYSIWETDDKPGHGASLSDYETKIIAGNSFDYSYIHGKAIFENGYSFCSASDESIWDELVELNDYKLVDLICGEEKKTFPPKLNNQKSIDFEIFPKEFREKITEYLLNSGNIFISGSYIGSDLYSDEEGKSFANNVLKFTFKTTHASKTGKIYSVNKNFSEKEIEFNYNSEFDEKIYKVEAPDEIGSINGSEVLMRFSENEFSTMIGYKKDYGVIA
ncbi:MAG: hypothetical protein N2043_12545, partial [Ignavibacterium sp.]|nr:hypothetical protein [Ignavibacterium sp.]